MKSSNAKWRAVSNRSRPHRSARKSASTVRSLHSLRVTGPLLDSEPQRRRATHTAMRNYNTQSCCRSVRSSLNVAVCALGLLACASDDGSEAVDAGLDAAPGTEAGASPALGAEAGAVATVDASPVGPVAGFGASCEQTACPTGLRCAVPLACPSFSCPKICVRDTADCVAAPCGPEAYCIGNVGATSGTCEPRIARGQACGMPPGGDPDINTCAEGLFCSADDPNRDTCVPALAAGATCPATLWLGTERQACTKGFTCAEPISGGDATCVAVKKAGETCLNHTDCAEGLRCAAQTCAPGRAGSAVR